MKLWTVQPVEAINIIEKTGAFTCDETKSDKDFRKAYEWIAKEMDKRQITHPKDLTLPLWAWHTRDWKHKKPDLRNIGLGTPGEKSVCIEFEIDDLSYEAMFQVLRKAEFESIILKHFHKLPEVNSFQYYRECKKWLERINIVTLQKDVMKCLKARTLMLIENKLEEKVPYELRFYAYFSKKIGTNYQDIDKLWNARIER